MISGSEDNANRAKSLERSTNQGRKRRSSWSFDLSLLPTLLTAVWCIGSSRSGQSRSGRTTLGSHQYSLPFDEIQFLASSDPLAALCNQHIAKLFAHYVAVLAPWYDLNDPHRTSTLVVPDTALRTPILFKAIIALRLVIGTRWMGSLLNLPLFSTLPALQICSLHLKSQILALGVANWLQHVCSGPMNW